MATIYLHIGMPKTGTSHLQRVLYRNEEVLNRHGYAFPQFEPFPRIGRSRNAHFLKYRIVNEKGKRDLKAEQALIEHHFNVISDVARTYDKIIMSEEGLWNVGNTVWDTYLKQTKKRKLDTKIIVYLRRQDLFLQSFWAQRVKERSEETFSEYIDKEGFKNLKLDYYARLKMLESYFGKENLIVRVYEKEQYEGEAGNILSDFLTALGVDAYDEFEIPDYVYNPSLTGIYLEIKRLLNGNPEIAVPQSFVKNLLVQLMKDKDDLGNMSRGVYYTGGRRAKLMSRFEEDNERVAREYLGREDGRLFYAPCGKEADSLPKYTSKELVAVCGDLLLLQERQYEEKIAQLNETIARRDATISHKQEVIDWETTPLPKKVTRKIRKIGRQILNKPVEPADLLGNDD